MAAASELITTWGFEVDDASLKRIRDVEVGINALSDAMSSLGHFVTGGAGAWDFFKGTISGAQEIQNMSRLLDMSTESIQEWQYAAKATGVSADTIMSSLSNLRAQFHMTERGVLNLARQFEKSSGGRRNLLGNLYGLDKETIAFLSQGPEKIRKLMAEAHKMNAIIPKEGIDRAADANKQLEAMKASFDAMAQSVAVELTPGLTKFVNQITKFVQEHPEGTINAVKIAFEGLVAVELLKGLGALVGIIKNLGLALSILGGGTAAAGLAGLTKLGAIGLYLAGALGGFALGQEALDNLINGTNKATWLEDLMSNLTDPLMEKMGYERGFLNKPTVNVPTQQENGLGQTQTSLFGQHTPAGGAPTFTGTTINIITNEPIGNVIDGVQTKFLGTNINQPGFGNARFS